jgi:tetratricopeptide (TPR) repeat protein
MKSFLTICFVLFFITINSFVSGQINKPSLPETTDAIKFYKELLTHNRHSAFAIYGLAYCYYMKNDFHAALKYSKKNLKHPNDYQADSYLIFASSLDALGRNSEAISVFEKAIGLFPNNYLLYYNHALTCYKYRDLDKAIASLYKAVQVSPLFVPSHYLLACTLFENTNDPQSLLPLFYGLMIDGDSARTQYALALALNFLNHKQEQIVVPFFEARLKINSIDQLLHYYIPVKNLKETLESLQPSDFASETVEYIQKAFATYEKNKEFYINFFEQLNEQSDLSTFSWYLMRYLKNTETEHWYTNHSNQLKSLANFLDKKLP